MHSLHRLRLILRGLQSLNVVTRYALASGLVALAALAHWLLEGVELDIAKLEKDSKASKDS
jgi:hypothetical protein